MFQVRHYLTADGRDPFKEWFSKLHDNLGKAQIAKRVARMALGNFGDHKLCRENVWELRINIGPGYRIYYGRSGKTVVLLLGGGIKRTQDADIDKAIKNWQDWRERPS
ncbi:MAG: type II toxin-antitoxin system RelE/ParE family toxin [Azoarcus sp.]|jgi:putative addiction module killer protein|nr:type II toxin-antitoxin system RelE/ParE family toxin [Azoarcus sp.]